MSCSQWPLHSEFAIASWRMLCHCLRPSTLASTHTIALTSQAQHGDNKFVRAVKFEI